MHEAFAGKHLYPMESGSTSTPWNPAAPLPHGIRQHLYPMESGSTSTPWNPAAPLLHGIRQHLYPMESGSGAGTGTVRDPPYTQGIQQGGPIWDRCLVQYGMPHKGPPMSHMYSGDTAIWGGEQLLPRRTSLCCQGGRAHMGGEQLLPHMPYGGGTAAAPYGPSHVPYAALQGPSAGAR